MAREDELALERLDLDSCCDIQVLPMEGVKSSMQHNVPEHPKIYKVMLLVIGCAP